MAVREESQAFVEQLRKSRALTGGDDAIADARQHHAVAVGGEALHRKQDDGDRAKNNDPLQVPVDVGLVDHVADQVGAECGAAGRHRHQNERDYIFAPMHQALFRKQAPDQGQGPVALFGDWQAVFVHPPSVGLLIGHCVKGCAFPCLSAKNFSSQNSVNRQKAPARAFNQATALFLRTASCFSHASAWATIVSRFWNCGRHDKAERMRSTFATSEGGSPGRRPETSTGKSRPQARRTAATTSRTEEPWPYPQLNVALAPPLRK